jgi:hypothetical protein
MQGGRNLNNDKACQVATRQATKFKSLNLKDSRYALGLTVPNNP